MTHGDILSWEKSEGEMCHEGDVLLRVKTDKADIDVESPEEAYLAKILVPAGTDNVPLGKVGRKMVLSPNVISAKIQTALLSNDTTCTCTCISFWDSYSVLALVCICGERGRYCCI